jgi:hypothetical protein
VPHLRDRTYSIGTDAYAFTAPWAVRLRQSLPALPFRLSKSVLPLLDARRRPAAWSGLQWFQAARHLINCCLAEVGQLQVLPGVAEFMGRARMSCQQQSGSLTRVRAAAGSVVDDDVSGQNSSTTVPMLRTRLCLQHWHMGHEAAHSPIESGYPASRPRSLSGRRRCRSGYAGQQFAATNAFD